MRIQTMLAGVAGAALMAFPAMAQDGQYREQLSRMITDAAAGTCSVGLMAPVVLDACNAQIEAMSPALASLGPIESITFVSAQDTPGGRVETWAVKFTAGPTLNWVIGQIQPDGKFSVVGTGQG